MKKHIILTILCLQLTSILSNAQQKKTPKKPTTVVKSTAPTTTKSNATTVTKTTTIVTTVPAASSTKPAVNSSSNSLPPTTTTTTVQSSGPTKEVTTKTKTKVEKVEVVEKTPKAEKVKIPKSSSSNDLIKTRVGFKAGVNNIFFLNSGKIGSLLGSGDPAMAIGFHGGVIANIGINEKVAIQPEILFSQQKVKITDATDNLIVSSNVIEIPLALQLNFGNTTKFFINIGGYGTYLLSGKLDAKVGGSSYATEVNLEGVSFKDRTDYGAILGVGVKFNQQLFIEARGNYSLKNSDAYFDSSNKSAKAISVGISLGYLF